MKYSCIANDSHPTVVAFRSKVEQTAQLKIRFLRDPSNFHFGKLEAAVKQLHAMNRENRVVPLTNAAVDIDELITDTMFTVKLPDNYEAEDYRQFLSDAATDHMIHHCVLEQVPFSVLQGDAEEITTTLAYCNLIMFTEQAALNEVVAGESDYDDDDEWDEDDDDEDWKVSGFSFFQTIPEEFQADTLAQISARAFDDNNVFALIFMRVHNTALSTAEYYDIVDSAKSKTLTRSQVMLARDAMAEKTLMSEVESPINSYIGKLAAEGDEPAQVWIGRALMLKEHGNPTEAFPDDSQEDRSLFASRYENAMKMIRR